MAVCDAPRRSFNRVPRCDRGKACWTARRENQMGVASIEFRDVIAERDPSCACEPPTKSSFNRVPRCDRGKAQLRLIKPGQCHVASIEFRDVIAERETIARLRLEAAGASIEFRDVIAERDALVLALAQQSVASIEFRDVIAERRRAGCRRRASAFRFNRVPRCDRGKENRHPGFANGHRRLQSSSAM